MANVDLKKAGPGQYLSFTLHGQQYSVPIFSIIEINQMSEITPIPETPGYVKGVLNLRGKIIPIIDLRVKFGLEATPYTKETCIIVIEAHEGLIGMIVDAVNEVVDFKTEQIEVAPRLGKVPGENYISGIGKVDNKVIILLDIEKVFKDGEFDGVAAAA